MITPLLTGASSSHILAYLDPGTGSYFLQIAVAGGLGLLFSAKRMWNRFKGVVTSPRHRDD
jgi:hypothetical protein